MTALRRSGDVDVAVFEIAVRCEKIILGELQDIADPVRAADIFVVDLAAAGAGVAKRDVDGVVRYGNI